MNLINLSNQTDNAFKFLLRRDPKFTGSLTLRVNFQKGVAKDLKITERKREKIDTE